MNAKYYIEINLTTQRSFAEKNRFLDLERAFIGDPVFDIAFLFCHYLIEVPSDTIGKSISFINVFMQSYLNTIVDFLSPLEQKKLENRIIRFLGVSILYRLFGFYLVIETEEDKSSWKTYAENMLRDTETFFVVQKIKSMNLSRPSQRAR